MSSIKKRINSTGRKRVPHERVRVDLKAAEAGKPLEASATIDLAGLNFPDSASIVLEAYQRSTAMRFELGTAGAPSIPGSLTLSELDPAGTVLFRLKLVCGDDDSGRIIGAADRLRPASDDQEDGRKSLFPIHMRDLGPEIWKLDMGDAGPILLLHFGVPGLLDEVRQNPLVQGILLPAALRGVLLELVRDTASDEDDEAAWRSEWMKFCRDELRMADDPSDLDDEARNEWVGDAVQRFCKSGDFVVRVRKMGTGV